MTSEAAWPAPLPDAARVDRLEPLRLDPLPLDAERGLPDALRELELDLLAALLVEPELDLLAALDGEPDLLVPFLDVEPDPLGALLDVEREADVSDRFACARPLLFPRRDWPD